ncbi:MAG TPA: tryptophan synthase subunit alpha [Chloroflexota bacterium]|nr:tryptophan synthase subunit alpha [Chloroflexota bacterium]
MSPATNRLDTTFSRLKQEGRIGFFPYVMAGYPDRETSARLLDVIAEAGADGFELGIPFSDPLADGVTIQRASTVALENGASVTMALDIVADLRQRHDLPIVMMSYVNPLLAYGLDRLCEDARTLGIDGFIVPDLSIEEATEFQARCAASNLHYVYLVAPTSTEERLRTVGERSGGFVYCVALVGTTGARRDLSEELAPFLARARAAIKTPLVVGFGISTPSHVAGLVGKADGAIVASALVDAIERTPPDQLDDAVRALVREFRSATACTVPA